VPAPLVALVTAAVVAWIGARFVPGFSVDTVGTRFSYVADGVTNRGIPQLPPLPIVPWAIPGPDGQPFPLSLATFRALAPSAFAIAMLGAIESLLSAVVADGMARTKHDPDAELVAQGVGNLVAPLFGGFAATGAIARTATNIRAGARSPVAAVVHAAFVLAAVLALAPLVAYLPMPALAALLVLVAWNMSEAKHFVHVLRVAPKSDVAVLVSCFALTILFDMVVSVTAGVMLAAMLFMRRMAEITGSQLSEGQVPELSAPLPKGVVLYRIAGPLFFGAAQKAMSSLETVSGRVRVVVLDMSAVPVMDATGLVNLESALERLAGTETLVVLAGVQGQPAKLLEKAGFGRRPGTLEIAATLTEALDHARDHLEDHPPPSSSIAAPASS
jgi:SulP family sulfate permease